MSGNVILATLAGVPLLALESVGWKLTEGTKPYIRDFVCSKENAETIWRASGPTKPVELVIQFSDRAPLIVKRLYVMSKAPATHPGRASVVVADCRVWWRRKLIRRVFNWRRATGETHLVEEKLERLDPAPNVEFARYSLFAEAIEWVPKEAIRDVFQEVTEGFFRFSEEADFSASLDLDTQRLEDPGDDAIDRVLAFTAGLKTFMTPEGVAVVDNRNAGGEEAEFGAARCPVALGQTLLEKIDFSRSRPTEFECFLVPHDEIRYDFLEGITAQTTTLEPRLLENVLLLPDRKLTLANGKTYTQGSWVEITQELLDAWNADPEASRVVSFAGRNYTLPPITFATIQKLWLVPGGYHAYYEILGGDSVWARRWDALKEHYRQTFRLSPRWRDRVSAVLPVRASISDPELRSRATADVYADHCLVWSAMRIAQTRSDPSRALASNRKAWVDLSDPIRALANAKVATTASIKIIDKDAYVFRASFRRDAAGRAKLVLPSLMSAKTDGGEVEIPSSDPRVALGAFLLQAGQLSSKHRFTTVLTVVPASPQGLKALHKIKVSPEAAKKHLPQKVRERVKECTGPKQQLFIGITEARFAWLDAAAAEIEDAVLKGTPRSDTRLVDPKHVQAVCECAAASFLSEFADRWEGGHLSTFDAERLPRGRIVSVSHELEPSGRALTRLDIPPDIPPVSIGAILPESTRLALFGAKLGRSA